MVYYHKSHRIVTIVRREYYRYPHASTFKLSKSMNFLKIINSELTEKEDVYNSV